MITLEGMAAIVGYINAKELPIMIIDRHSKILFASAIVCESLGAEPCEVIGQDLNKFIDQTQSHPHGEELDRVDEGESVEAYTTEGVVTGICKNHEPVPVFIGDRMKYRVGQTRYYSADVIKVK